MRQSKSLDKSEHLPNPAWPKSKCHGVLSNDLEWGAKKLHGRQGVIYFCKTPLSSLSCLFCFVMARSFTVAQASIALTVTLLPLSPKFSPSLLTCLSLSLWTFGNWHDFCPFWLFYFLGMLSFNLPLPTLYTALEHMNVRYSLVSSWRQRLTSFSALSLSV